MYVHAQLSELQISEAKAYAGTHGRWLSYILRPENQQQPINTGNGNGNDQYWWHG